MERFKPNQYPGEESPNRTDIRQEYITEEKTLAQLELENTPEVKEAFSKVREVLDSVNQERLFEIFKEYYGKVGNDTNDFYITPIDEINLFWEPDSSIIGRHAFYQKPELNVANLQSENEDLIINVLIHEYVHELSSTLPIQTLFETGNHDDIEVEEKLKSGVSTSKLEFVYNTSTKTASDEFINAENTFLNEGITQLIADNIHQEYTRRVGKGSSSEERSDRDQTNFSAFAYLENQFNIRLYIAWLSAMTDVSEDIIETAVIRAYFRNATIFPDDISELFIEIDPADDILLTQLKLPELATKLFSQKIDDENFISFVKKIVKYVPKNKLNKFKGQVNELFDNYEKALKSEQN